SSGVSPPPPPPGHQLVRAGSTAENEEVTSPVYRRGEQSRSWACSLAQAREQIVLRQVGLHGGVHQHIVVVGPHLAQEVIGGGEEETVGIHLGAVSTQGGVALFEEVAHGHL